LQSECALLADDKLTETAYPAPAPNCLIKLLPSSATDLTCQTLIILISMVINNKG